MKQSLIRTLSALFLREWIMMRTWLFSLLLIMLADPVINLINAFGAPVSVKDKVQLTSLFTSLYTTFPMGELTSVHGSLAATNYNPAGVPIFIHGDPPASLWVIACATVLGALMATLDKQPAILTETLSSPVRKQDLVRAKMVLGTVYLGVVAGLRTLVLFAANTLSPFHFPVHTLLMSGTVNFFVGLASFCIVFFIGLLMGNAILAWAMGCLAIIFPLAIGAVMRFIGHVSGTFVTAYNLEHHFVLRLSPFWYTSYNTNVRQHIVHSSSNSPAVPQIKNIVMNTGIATPLLLVIGALVVFGLAYFGSVLVATRSKTEHMENLFLTRKVLVGSVSLVSIVFGSVAAQMVGNIELWVFFGAAVLCYASLWVLQARMLTLVTRRMVSSGGARSY